MFAELMLEEVENTVKFLDVFRFEKGSGKLIFKDIKQKKMLDLGIRAGDVLRFVCAPAEDKHHNPKRSEDGRGADWSMEYDFCFTKRFFEVTISSCMFHQNLIESPYFNMNLLLRTMFFFQLKNKLKIEMKQVQT